MMVKVKRYYNIKHHNNNNVSIGNKIPAFTLLRQPITRMTFIQSIYTFMFLHTFLAYKKIDLNCMGTLLIGVNLFSLAMHWGQTQDLFVGAGGTGREVIS